MTDSAGQKAPPPPPLNVLVYFKPNCKIATLNDQ